MPRSPALPPVNPFRIGGVVSDAFFTNRADELRRIEKALLSPGDKLLVFGPRRMGKSSTLDRAIANVSARKGVAFRADLSGATTVTDIANRILQAASRAMGRRWQDVLAGFLKTLTLKVNLSLDPATGLALPSLSLEGRTDALEEQRASLARVLDSIDQLAAQRKARVGIVLDEFQTISRFGGEGAEWHLRGIIERHQHVAYVGAGSELSLLAAMKGEGRAFYKLFREMHLGPIDPDHMARWIDERLSSAGVPPHGIGEHVVATAGPRTRDIVELARTVYDVAAPVGHVGDSTLDDALQELLDTYGESFRRQWEDLPPSQQNVLRAVATGEPQLYGRPSLMRFGVRSSAEAAQAVEWLAKREILTRDGKAVGFDNPFFQAWVAEYALPDVGILDSTREIVQRLQGPPPGEPKPGPKR